MKTSLSSDPTRDGFTRPRLSREAKARGEARVDALLARYTKRGIPLLPAINAGIRELKSRGLDGIDEGRHSINYLKRLRVRERRRRGLPETSPHDP